MRKSGVELLRVYSIFLILINHVFTLVLGAPTHIELINNPIPTVTKISFISLAIICVNTFVIISGWFEIKRSTFGLAKLIFQCIFFYLLELLINYLFIDHSFFINGDIVKGLISSIFRGWFISAYIILFLIAPIINSYVTSYNQKSCRTILGFIYFFLFIYGWLFISSSGNQSTFQRGYSFLFLAVLYFTVRYIKVFYFDTSTDNWLKNISRNQWFIIYIITVILNIVLEFTFLRYNLGYLSTLIFQYTSPIIIIQSFCIFRFFAGLKFQSKLVNTIGGSALAIMLIHFSNNGFFFKKIITHLYRLYSGISCISLIFAFLISISILGLLTDQVRIILWKLIEPKIKDIILKTKNLVG